MSKRPLTVLVAEDEGSSRMLYTERLQEEGFQVVETENGAGALAELHDGVFDLMITDLKMPGMSALEMIPEVRKEFPNLPIIVVSAYYGALQEEFQKKGFQVQAFFSKPVELESLILKARDLAGTPLKPSTEK